MNYKKLLFLLALGFTCAVISLELLCTIVYMMPYDAPPLVGVLSNVFFYVMLGISFITLKPAFKRLILKEETKVSYIQAKYILYGTIGLGLILLIPIIQGDKFMKSDKSFIESTITQINKELPQKEEWGELNSMKLNNDTLEATFIFYEYRNVTMQSINPQQKDLKIAAQHLINNKALVRSLQNEKYIIKVKYIGNRSGEVRTACCPASEMSTEPIPQ